MKKTILITGGFGFLGGRLSQYLSDDYNIILGTRSNQADPYWLPQVEVVQTQWDSPSSLEKSCKGVDSIVHFAGVNAQDCTADPALALEHNAVATARLLQAAVRQGVSRFVYFSTAHVYGSPLSGVITEETCPANLHSYAASHRAGEDVVRAAHQRGEIEGIVVRLSNAFGAPAHQNVNCWMLLVNDLCRQAVVNRSLVMTSSGKQRRDFVTLFDVVRAISHLLHLPKEQLEDGVFNVGGNWAPCVIDMARLIQSRCSDVLDFVPEIIRPEPSSCESAFDLEYRIDKLLSTGFSLTGCVDDEVDTTLLLCQDVFGKK
jgi:UDP-glucose 4-epimerase